MARGASRAVVNFMRAETFSPTAIRLARPTMETVGTKVVTDSGNTITVDRASNGDRVFKATAIKEEGELETESNFEASRKHVLATNDSVLFGKDIWGFSKSGRKILGVSNRARTVSWKVNSKSRKAWAK